jgi:hypothetical protein
MNLEARRQWFTPVIPATQEAEIRRIVVESQPGQIVCETLTQKKKKKNHEALSSNPNAAKKRRGKKKKKDW